MSLNRLQKTLLNDFQQDFPLTPRPYQHIADQLNVTEDEVIHAFNELNADGFISRIGAVISPNRLGVSCLVAMQIPEARLQAVAEMISHYREVNHNYERENRFNLWFVLIADNPQHLSQVLDEIEQKSGFATLRLPLVKDYFINLGFQLDLP
jgi:siroheme decarboxylase